MYYLRLDDLRVKLLCQSEGIPVMVERNILGGDVTEIISDLAGSINTRHLDVLVSGPTTIVPSDELPSSASAHAAIFNACFNFMDDTPRLVFSNEIPALRSHLLFAIKEPTYDALVKYFPAVNVRFVSSLTPLLLHFANRPASGARFRVYINCREGFIDVFVFDGQQLAVLNSFPVTAVADAVYYTLAFSKTVGFDISTTPYYVVGEPALSQSVVEQLRRFARVVTTRSLDEEFGINAVTHTEGITFDLAAHILCAS